jgi:hypothetical protein
MSNDKLNYKIVNFNTSYDSLLKVIKKTGDKIKIAKACNLYSKLHRLETGLKKQMQKIEELLEEQNLDNSEPLDPSHTDTQSDYSDASEDNSIQLHF